MALKWLCQLLACELQFMFCMKEHNKHEYDCINVLLQILMYGDYLPKMKIICKEQSLAY